MPESEFVSRPPDYVLKAMDKAKGLKAEVGIAWKQPDSKSIRVKLNPFVVLDANQDLVLTLFVNDRTTAEGRKKNRDNLVKQMWEAAANAERDEEDEVPF